MTKKTPTRTKKAGKRPPVIIPSGLERVSTPLCLLHQMRDVLSAMNASGAHAASWVQPRSHVVGYLIDAVDAVLSEHDHTTEIKPTRKKKR